MTVSDAEQLAGMLLDESRCAYPVEQVDLLTGPAANRHAVLGGLAQLRAAGPDATVVVYFSGHGVETPSYCLLPYGYDMHFLAETAISGAEFSAALQAIPARQLLVLLDCCHAGGQASLQFLPKVPVPAEALSVLAHGAGRVILASSRKDELSWAGTNSYFTTALLEGLSGYGAAEPDGYARVLDIALWVGRRVPDLTSDRQHPIIKVSNLRDNFAVAWYAGGAKTIAQSPRLAQPNPADLHDLTAISATQRATWQRMLMNYHSNLLLIEERMSEYVEFAAIPLQLVSSQRRVQAAIAELEDKLAANP